MACTLVSGHVWRRKQRGAKRQYKFYIADPSQVTIIDMYLATAGSEAEMQLLRKMSKNADKRTRQVLEKNTVAKIHYDIATFLHLPNPKDYTGHMFRRTGATLLLDAGMVHLFYLQLKEGGGC